MHPCLSAPVSGLTPYEAVRAQELNALLGPKGGSAAVDLLCDLHSSTANVGLCLIAHSDSDWICLHICKHLQARVNPLAQISHKPTNMGLTAISLAELIILHAQVMVF